MFFCYIELYDIVAMNRVNAASPIDTFLDIQENVLMHVFLRITNTSFIHLNSLSDQSLSNDLLFSRLGSSLPHE